MFALNRRIVGVALVVLTTIISQCFASWSPYSVPHSNPLKCEEKLKDVEKLTVNETSSVHEDIRNLMDSYIDWGEHLNAAPLAISVLGKLIVISDQEMYLPSPHSFFISPKKFNYPKSFRNSLVQISRQGNLALLKAHENIVKIRVYNSNASKHIKVLSRFLMSRNESSNSLYWPMMRFEGFTLQSKEFSDDVVNKFQMVLGLIEEMIVTAKQLELRRGNTQIQVLDKVVERNDSFEIINIYNMEAIKALQTALNELTKLKSAWMKLIEFYNKMSILISKSTEESKAFIDFVNAIKINTTQLLGDEKILRNFTDKIQKATEAAFLVHGVSGMYVDVSEMYIVDQMTHLDKMMKLTEVADMDKLQLELSWSTESDAEGIRHFIKADEFSLRDKLVERHNEIVNEYRWMIDCWSYEDRQFIQ